MKTSRKTIAINRKARHEYSIEETIQAGISLLGCEVKSLREGRGSLNESFIHIIRQEAFIINLHIPPYSHGNRGNQDPLRMRKLLLHRREINALEAGMAQDGYTIVPLQLYFSRGMVKVDIALAKGKKLYDKRDDLAKKDAKRDMERAFKEQYK